MAAKLLHSLTDDNPDLQKQIGCMTGVFQLFDRHQIVTGRRFPGHSPKRLPPGSPQLDNRSPESESSNLHQRPYIVEAHSNKIVQDKNNRTSTESSRDSFSSMSRSSSFSSLDCNVNKTNHQEPDAVVFPDTPSRDFLTRQSCGSRISVDLRDVVKDSMYRHKPTAKDEVPDHVMNYRESLDALAKFEESKWYHNEPRELSRSKSYQIRDGPSFSVPKDCPRFSYDGRETNRLSFQSRDISKSMGTKQLEEPPRLSLDSKESSTRSLRNPKSDDVITANRSTMQSRPHSVVAKLMGLEALPDSVSAKPKESGLGPIRTSRVEDLNLLSKSLKPADIFGPIKMHSSSRSSPREPTSPLWRNSDMKPISRIPIEPAPWKQRDGSRSPQRPVSRASKSPTKIHSSYSSVYSEVDKRLKDLQFTQSGKDLRALKQILEAMQSIEARKEETQTTVTRQSVATQNERFSDCQNPRGGSDNLRAYESPIVIMKPAKLVERSGIPVEEIPSDDRKICTNYIPKSTRRENTVGINEVKSGGRHMRNAVNAPGLTKQQQLAKENATTSGKSATSVSPRLQQKRPELERRSRPPTPPADSSKVRKQSAKQVSESSSPGGRRRSKYSNVQQHDAQHHVVNGESKKSSYKETQVSHEGFTTPESSKEIDNRRSPSSIQEWESPDDVVSDTKSSGVTSEINRKKLQNIENLVQKLTRLNSSHDEAHTDYIASLCENTKPDDRYISEILLASGLLLRDLGSNLTTFQFHSSGYPINPELFLVLEQTKFSNLAKQEPDKSEKIIKKEKFHRKLIFDAVNEILAGKLASSVPFQKPFKLAKKTLNGQKLLRDLCLEIEQLHAKKNKENISFEEEDDDGLKSVLWEEVLNRAESWTDYDGKLPVLALEVERLIFKDLVNEVVLGEAADGRRIKPGRRCRQLFSK
ncbi:hypothetical protein M8C21_022314 [Ambrosia artemisiifolia]|uniref:Protein LONGIFOLIA 1 n=1 Tax=Ambrosia artemisiifolia TaxID=4212 RepID=A0AAD5GCW9_AMBAR|nr:hypothetical protein M8C21_022314 [Ambrosia artemisiifolia]